MSRDALGTDDKEPWRGGPHVTTREFDKLEQRFNRLDEKVDCMDKKLDRAVTHIESQEKAKKAMYRNIGIITGAINAVILMILNGWKVVSGQ